MQDESQQEVKVPYEEPMSVRASHNVSMPAPRQASDAEPWLGQRARPAGADVAQMGGGGAVSSQAPASPANGDRGETLQSSRGASREHEERARLRELMKAFVSRGMHGVQCELFSEAFSGNRQGTYIIDDRLQSMTFELKEDPNGAEMPLDSEHEPTPVRPARRWLVPFAGVSEVVRDSEAGATPRRRLAEGVANAIDGLSNEERRRLLLLTYESAVGEPKQTLAFLEASENDALSFGTCVRILRRYMDDQGHKQRMQVMA